MADRQSPLLNQSVYDQGVNPYAQPYDNQQNYQAPPQQNSYYQNSSYQDQAPQYDDAKYDYDPYHINYSQMSVNQWNNVSVDNSQYSQYWSSPQSFEPQTFSQNTQTSKGCRDMIWAILFWINFIITLGLTIGVILADTPNNDNDPQPSPQPYQQTNNGTRNTLSDDFYDENITENGVYRDIGISLAAGLVINIVHFCYASFAPYAYVRFGLFIGVVISIALSLISCFTVGSFLFLFYPVFFVFIALLMYCVMKEYIPVSAAVLKQTCKLIRSYPSIIFLCLFQGILDVAVNLMYGILIFMIYQKEWSYILYIYVVLSYYWVIMTFGYVTYMTGAGLGASWYFLNNTVYFPRSPVWQSFKRAMTTSFGSASLAGFLIAIIEVFKYLARSAMDSDNTCVSILGCIAMCFISCLEVFTRWMNHYALIYCAVFGVPFKEGCRRWAELSCKKFVDVMIEGCVISNCLSYNFFLFTLGGALLGYGIGAIWGYLSAVLVCVFTMIFVLCIFTIFEQPILTITDTLFVCFAEAPEKLHTSASELYNDFTQLYNLSLGKKLNRSNNRQ